MTLTIAGEDFVGWSSVFLSLALDNHPRASFVAPFDSLNLVARRRFKPLSFQPITVAIGRRKVFSGLMLTPELESTPEHEAIQVQCYAPAGVLSDCTVPWASLPMEWRGVKLPAIAKAICDPFGISVVWEGLDQGAPFKKVALKPEASPQQFLAERAKERNRVVSSNESGALVFVDQSLKNPIPVARLPADLPPISVVKSQWKPQEWYSEITAVAPTKHGRPGGHYTIKNPHYEGDTPRPHTYTVQDAEAGDLKLAAETKLARTFGNVVGWTINNIPGLRDQSGDLFWPGATITTHAPGAYIFTETALTVRNVEMKIEPESLETSLGVVLPGAFNGQVPKVVPWAA